MEQIEELLRFLPKKDILVAQKLLVKRDFSGLCSLIWDDIKKVSREQRKENCKEEYKNIPLDLLMELKLKVDRYNVEEFV